MSVVRIDALCACEGCEKRFGVELDLAEELDHEIFPDFESLVCDTIRRNNTKHYVWRVRAKQTIDREALDYQATIQGGLMLCDVCSRKCDDLPIEDDLTRAQVLDVLGLPREAD